MECKRVNIIFFLLFSVTITFSQQVQMSNQEVLILRKSVLENAKQHRTILSEFIQLKHLDFLSNDIKSSGMLYYKFPESIKWQYQEPFNYSATFKGSDLFINDDGEKSNVDLGSNKAFKSLNTLVVRSVKGDLFDDSEFEISYFKNATNYKVHFIPKDKKLKTFIREFIIGFDLKSHEVIEVKMMENSEDYTLLIFVNQQFNTPISDEVFAN